MPGHRGRPAAAGQRQRRRYGADLGPQTGQQRTILEGHQRGVTAVCPVTVAGPHHCWPAPVTTARCGSGIPRPASSHYPGRPPGLGQGRVPGHRGRTAHSWPVPATTGRCGSGTPRPVSSSPPSKATRTGSGPCARSPWPTAHSWPVPATTGRCGSGTPAPGRAC